MESSGSTEEDDLEASDKKELLRRIFARGGGGAKGRDVNVVSSMRSSLDGWWANFLLDFCELRTEDFLGWRTVFGDSRDDKAYLWRRSDGAAKWPTVGGWFMGTRWIANGGK